MKVSQRQYDDEIALALIDALIYNVTFGPDDYPSEDHITWQGEKGRIESNFDALAVRNLKPEKRQHLILAISEFHKAIDSFSVNDKGEGRRHLEACIDHVKDLKRGKKIKIDFIAGMTGVVRTK